MFTLQVYLKIPKILFCTTAFLKKRKGLSVLGYPVQYRYINVIYSVSTKKGTLHKSAVRYLPTYNITQWSQYRMSEFCLRETKLNRFRIINSYNLQFLNLEICAATKIFCCVYSVFPDTQYTMGIRGRRIVPITVFYL